MAHQGKILETLIKRKGLTQAQMAEAMGLSRTGFIRYFKEEELTEPFIEKAMKALNVPRSVFFPEEKGHNQQALGDGNVQLIGSQYQLCKDELVQTQKELIEQQKAYIALQQQMMEMQKQLTNK